MTTTHFHTTDNPARVDFWKSLLKIEANVAVTLAHQDLPVERILQFVPGVMIQFEKPCDTPLCLEIDGNRIAEGEVVKVGDKFGLRITEICNREERWIPLVKAPKSDASK
jgi:flagellar motor switch/type III secretory pathway protein FliN